MTQTSVMKEVILIWTSSLLLIVFSFDSKSWRWGRRVFSVRAPQLMIDVPNYFIWIATKNDDVECSVYFTKWVDKGFWERVFWENLKKINKPENSHWFSTLMFHRFTIHFLHQLIYINNLSFIRKINGHKKH